MAHSTAVKKVADIERFEARITADKKNLLKNAAELIGRTLTDFVMSSAYDAAVRVIQDHQQLHLSINDRTVFIQTLLNPPSPSSKLLKAAKKYKKDVLSNDK